MVTLHSPALGHAAPTRGWGRCTHPCACVGRGIDEDTLAENTELRESLIEWTQEVFNSVQPDEVVMKEKLFEDGFQVVYKGRYDSTAALPATHVWARCLRMIVRA